MTLEGIQFTKKQWIPALRSGKYKQGIGQLHDKNEQFCCLGVACDLLKYELSLNFHKDDFSNYYNDESVYLPSVIADYLGIDAKEQEHLALLNDEDGYNFNQIADYLEGKIAEIECPVTVHDSLCDDVVRV